MIKQYGLFNEHEDNDNLLILFQSPSFNHVEEKGEINIYYHNNEVVGYLIHNFIRYAKIKYSGIIFLPSKLLIDVVNSVLVNYGLDTLAFKKESGYVVRTDNNHKRVFALEGTFLRDKTISKGRYCTYYDLYIKSNNENDLIEIEEDIKDGIDFFQMEEK